MWHGNVRFSLFYYHTTTGETMWKEPDWDPLWAERRKRAQYVESAGGWEKMFDLSLQLPFWFSLREGSYTWEDPLALM